MHFRVIFSHYGNRRHNEYIFNGFTKNLLTLLNVDNKFGRKFVACGNDECNFIRAFVKRILGAKIKFRDSGILQQLRPELSPIKCYKSSYK